MEFLTKRDAVNYWIRGFNCIPTELMFLLSDAKLDDDYFAMEVTPITVNNIVMYDSENGEDALGEVVMVDYENGEYWLVGDESGECFPVPFEDVTLEDDGNPNFLPDWETMWTFDTEEDIEWICDEDNRRRMAECGFRIFYQSTLGYVFGIDGECYDFYDSHWKALYEARGLDWEIIENKQEATNNEKDVTP